MLSLIRSGPKLLLVRTQDPERTAAWLARNHRAEPGSLGELYDAAGEEQCIVILTSEPLDQPVPLDSVTRALLIPDEMDAVLCGFINDGEGTAVDAVRAAPRMILMRGMGDLGKSLELIRQDFPCETGTAAELLDAHTDKGVLVALTEKPLHLRFSIEDLYPTLLHINEPYSLLFRELRANALKYLNEGIGNRDWCELEIRIFDRLSMYRLHYQRLLQAIDGLEMGLILGESWSKDSPRFMMTVDVYRVRLFTLMDPLQVKRYLLALEYLENGIRIADHDVYLNQKKIYWGDAARKEAKSRQELAALYRRRLLEKFTERERKDFLELERKLALLQKE